MEFLRLDTILSLEARTYSPNIHSTFIPGWGGVHEGSLKDANPVLTPVDSTLITSNTMQTMQWYIGSHNFLSV